MRQAWAIARVEMRRAFLSRRGLWVYLLALFPAASYLAHDVQMKFTEERWARHGRTSVQLIDSFTKGEKAEDILKRAPAPASDDSWTERRDDDGDRGRERQRKERADRKQPDREREDREQADKDRKERAEESVQRRVLTYYDGQRVVDLRFSDGVLQEKFVRPVRDFDKDRRVFAGIFQYFYLRLAIFFGCLGIFMNLFRGEMLDKTLHFWFLAPVRREVLLAGKYIAGIVAACVIFGGGALLGYAAMIWPHTGSGALAFQSAVGWSHAFWYVTAAVLGCLGYGSVFLAAGLLLRNPIVPAALILLWESINGFLPSVLQKLSVLYYLQSLCPEAAPMDEESAILRLLFAPAGAASKSLAILGLLAVTALVLWAASRAVKRIEINYSTE
jgi:ABC-type transport system involved in multi-copper enzyme maturation permease subunit